MVTDLDTERQKSKKLHQSLLAAESRGNEVQKKYEALKVSYFKAKESIARLEASQASAAQTESNQAATAEGANNAARPVNGTNDVQTKYDHLKGKFRVSSSSFFVALIKP